MEDTKQPAKDGGTSKPNKRRLEISIAVKLNLKDMNDLLNEEEIVKDIVRKHLTPNAESETKVIADYLQERSHTWPRIDIPFKKDDDNVEPLTTEEAKKAEQTQELQEPENDDNQPNETVDDKSKTEANSTIIHDGNIEKDVVDQPTDLQNKESSPREDKNIKEMIQIEPKVDIAIPRKSIDLMPYSPQLESVTFDYGRHYGKIPECNVITNDNKEQNINENGDLNEKDLVKDKKLRDFENDIIKKEAISEYVGPDIVRNYAGQLENKISIQPEEIKPTLKDENEACFLDDRTVNPDTDAAKSSKTNHNTFKTYHNKETPSDANTHALEKNTNLTMNVRNVFRKILPGCKVSYLHTNETTAVTTANCKKNIETAPISFDSQPALKSDLVDQSNDLEKTLSLSKVKKHLRVEDDIQTINKNEDFAQNPLDYTLESEKSL